VLQKSGYFSAVDWWSLGVMTYEFLFGRRPFRGVTNEELQHSICNEHLSFGDCKEISPGCVEAMRGFMQRDSKKRLGAKEAGGPAMLKAAKWFEGLDWQKVENREIPPPFVPDVRSQKQITSLWRGNYYRQ
jgi:serine/threonine kinase 32